MSVRLVCEGLCRDLRMTCLALFSLAAAGGSTAAAHSLSSGSAGDGGAHTGLDRVDVVEVGVADVGRPDPVRELDWSRKSAISVHESTPELLR